VRASVRALAGSDFSAMDAELRILVIGGSQGASILSDVVPGALASLPAEMVARLSVSHQARDADHDAAVSAYSAAGIRAEVQPFFTDVPERLDAAHLVISRSGASSVADISCIGRPSILVPLSIAIRDEQTANARGLVEAGGAVLITENDLAERLGGEVEAILSDPEQARSMAEAAKSQGRPDAVDRLKDLVLSLVEAT